MAPVRRIVVDVLKPHDPSLVEFTEQIGDVDDVAGATASLVERDREVENVKLTVAGEDVDLAAVEATIERLGGSVHSIDQISCGEVVVEERRTPQDR